MASPAVVHGDPGVTLERHLVSCIQENLALYLLNNAIFLAERLVAEFPSEPNVFLLATCYYRSNQTYRAYSLLQGLQGPQCRYLLALCCMDMGKLTEAEAALTPDSKISSVPNGAAGCYLLGRIFQLSNRHNVAIVYFNQALQIDPMMWCAYEELCALGADTEASQYVNAVVGSVGAMRATANGADTAEATITGMSPGWRNEDEVMEGDMTTGGGTSGSGGGFTFTTHTPTSMMGDATPMLGGFQNNATEPRWGTLSAAGGGGGGTSGAPSTAGGFITPAVGGPASNPPPPPARGGAAPSWAAVAGAGAGGSTQPSTGGVSPLALPSWQSGGYHRKFLDEGKMRKISNKLFVEPASVLKQASMASGRAPSSSAPHPDDGAGLLQTAAVSGVPSGERSLEGQAAAVALLQALGEGLRLLATYRCREAIAAFDHLPVHHKHTGWVLMQIGRAYYEMMDYTRAAEAFQLARSIDPNRLQGLEVYSTVLWHIKDEVKLSQLAREAIALDRMAPEAWCAMGNCFSLQKEHDAALRFFQRALQLDHNFPYAHTLCGHEYFANEDFEKGITCYRNAIRIDPRHYNAWFGMGHIYYRQEKYGMAEYHFRRALSINERSSVLRCYLGMALHKLKRGPEALEMLASATEADPRNPLARFERAGVLAAEGHLEAALDELRALHDVAPREASVLFHMGKVFKKMGQTENALAAFSEALVLQPPSADTNLIKAAIDRVTVEDAEEEEEL